MKSIFWVAIFCIASTINYGQSCSKANFVDHFPGEEFCEIEVFVSKSNKQVTSLHLSIDGTEQATIICEGKECEGFQTFKVDPRFCNDTHELGIRFERSKGTDCIAKLGFQTLPIELLYFKASIDQNQNIIEWATATEVNNQWQIVERSADGKNNWQEMTHLSAKGWSTEQTSYQWTDENPLVRSYYQLKAVDFDGATQYSDIVVVDHSVEQLQISNIYPIPAIDHINIDYVAPSTETLSLKILDAVGRLAQQQSLSPSKGLNQELLTFQNLTPGTYFLVLENGKYRQVHKISVKA